MTFERATFLTHNLDDFRIGTVLSQYPGVNLRAKLVRSHHALFNGIIAFNEWSDDFEVLKKEFIKPNMLAYVIVEISTPLAGPCY